MNTVLILFVLKLFNQNQTSCTLFCMLCVYVCVCVCVDTSNQESTHIVPLLSCVQLSLSSIFESHQFTLFISTHQYQHWFIDLSQYLCCTLQHQFIEYQTHSESVLQWNTFIVWIISQYIHISTLIALWMNTQFQYNTLTIKFWNDFKLKRQLHKCISNGLQYCILNQSIVCVVSWYKKSNYYKVDRTCSPLIYSIRNQ
jgi:hypothetical protein